MLKDIKVGDKVFVFDSECSVDTKINIEELEVDNVIKLSDNSLKLECFGTSFLVLDEDLEKDVHSEEEIYNVFNIKIRVIGLSKDSVVDEVLHRQHLFFCGYKNYMLTK